MKDEEAAPQPPDPTAGPGSPVAGMAPEISRRISSILDAVEREASRLREEAQTEANRYTEGARRHADALVAERQRRISELSDELVVKSEAVVARLDDAAPVRQGFANLVRALGDAAERLSIESQTTRERFAPPSFHETAGQSPQPQVPGPVGSPQPQPAPEHYPPQPQPGPPSPAPSGFAQQVYPYRAPSQPAWQPPAVADVAAPAMPAARSATRQELEDARMIAIQLAGAGGTRADVRGHLNRAFGIIDAEATLDGIFGPGTGEDACVPWRTSRR